MKDKKGLLQKPFNELTKDEVEGMKIAIGVTGRPYPVYETRMAVDAKGNHVPVTELRLLEDDSNPLYIYSERSYDEVMGYLYRNMPSPSMSEVFIQGLLLRRPDSKRRIQYIKGEPGAGKSFLGKLHGNLRSKRGAVVVDCGGKNLSELLYETVLDFENDKTFYVELDKRLAQGKLNPTSLRILREAVGTEAFHQNEKGRVSIDWNQLGNAPTVEGRDDNYMEKLRKALTDVSRLEGLDQFGGNALGLVTKEGPLITAYKEGREIVLDEYNKSKEGTDDSLQTVLQFLAGEIDTCTVENRLKTKGDAATHSFTFDRKNIRPGFFVTATGNAIEDGVTTRPLSKSANSRLQPVTLPKATLLDWHHRWCQVLLDLPLSTLYYSAKDQWDQNKKGFREFLRHRLVAGRSDEEIKNIPEEHFAFANNWERVFLATKNLARFCDNAANLLDPESGKFEGENFDAILAEIEEGEYTDEVSFDFRKIIKYVEMARDNSPKAKGRGQSLGFDVGNWEKPKTLAPRQREPLLLNYGTRIVEAINKDILNMTYKRDKRATFQQLLAWQKQYGLIDVNLSEAKKKEGNLVAELLNISPYEGYDIESNAEIVQKLVCTYLREKHPEINVSDDKIISLQRVQMALALILADEETMAAPANDNDGKKKKGWANRFFAINDDKKTLSKNPFLVGETFDSTPEKEGDDFFSVEIPDEDKTLAVEEDVLQTLILPIIGKKNLRAFWNRHLEKSGAVTPANTNEALAMAQNQDPSGLGMTTVKVFSGGKKSSLHIVHNAQNGKTIIVGDGVSERLKAVFAHCKIEYFERHDPSVQIKLRSALVELADKYSAKVETSLKQAFLMRNQSTINPESDMDRPLAELMVADDVECFLEHSILKKAQPLKPKAG